MLVFGNLTQPSVQERKKRLKGILTIISHRALGTYDGDLEVEVEYPTAFAKAILQGRSGGKFRYVHLGGAFTEEDQEKSLWLLPTARRGRVCSSYIRLALFAAYLNLGSR